MQHIFLDSISSTLRFAGIPFISIPFSSTSPEQNNIKNSDCSLCGWGFRAAIGFMQAVIGCRYFWRRIKEQLFCASTRFPLIAIDVREGR